MLEFYSDLLTSQSWFEGGRDIWLITVITDMSGKMAKDWTGSHAWLKTELSKRSREQILRLKSCHW